MKARAIRVGDWESALSSHIASTEGRPHAWGSFDCAIDAADAVLAITGIDFAIEFRGRYRTALGSARALRRLGNGSFEATLDAKFEAVEPGFARRGDLALHEGSVGVVMGPFALFLVEGQAGRVRVPRAQWEKAWSIG